MGRDSTTGTTPALPSALTRKRMFVQSTNIGYDVTSNHFDLMVPGGGLGIFDGCTGSLPGVSALDLGAKYGGFLTTCRGRHGGDHAAEELCQGKVQSLRVQPQPFAGGDVSGLWIGSKQPTTRTYGIDP